MTDDDVIVKVQMPPLSETDNSWRLLTKRSKDTKFWSSGAWFPKKCCTLVASKHEKNVGILTMPEWLFDNKCEEGVEFTNLQNNIIS